MGANPGKSTQLSCLILACVITYETLRGDGYFVVSVCVVGVRYFGSLLKLYFRCLRVRKTDLETHFCGLNLACVTAYETLWSLENFAVIVCLVGGGFLESLLNSRLPS